MYKVKFTVSRTEPCRSKHTIILPWFRMPVKKTCTSKHHFHSGLKNLLKQFANDLHLYKRIEANSIKIIERGNIWKSKMDARAAFTPEF